jgi:hypothetical protein
MATNSGPTDQQGIGGELAGGDRGTSGIDRAEEARIGDVGSGHPVDQPETEAEPEAADRVALGGGAPTGEAPATADINPGDGPGQTPGE